MSKQNRINFQEIAERVDTIIDIADDKSLIVDYRTFDLIKMVEEEFEVITSTLTSLPDIDIHVGK